MSREQIMSLNKSKVLREKSGGIHIKSVLIFVNYDDLMNARKFFWSFLFPKISIFSDFSR